MLGTKGYHTLLDLWGVQADALNDVKGIEKLLIDAALYAGAEIRESAFHKFAPDGVSGVVIISESHLTIHTWPEQGYASIDVYTCGEKIMTQKAIEYICDNLKHTKANTKDFIRGEEQIREV